MIWIGPEVSVSVGKTTTLMVLSTVSGDATISCSDWISSETVALVANEKHSFTVDFSGIGTYVITAALGLDSDNTTVSYRIDKCRVYGTIVDVLGRPLRNSEVLVEPLRDGSELSVQAAVIYTDHIGHFEIELLRGIECVLHAKDAAYKKLITVPDQNSVDIKDL